MQLTLVSFFFASLVLQAAAQGSTCSGQQYNNINGFPVSNGGCYPLGYYQTSDLGNTNPTDAQSRCQSSCTAAGSRCGSVVAQVNKAADSNLYSGTCFFFAPGQTPKQARQCGGKAYLLQGYAKDDTLACFSSSKAPAAQFCSSYISVPLSTVKRTVTLAPTTVTRTTVVTTTKTDTTFVSATRTVTSTTQQTTTTTTTVPTALTQTAVASVTQTNTISGQTILTVTATAYASSTSTATVSATATATTTNQVTVTTFSITTTTSTATSTSTIITSSTTTVALTNKKRAAAAAATPACVTAGTPPSWISAACSCLSIKPSTTTSTTTLPRSTVTVTTTSTTTRTDSQAVTVTSATATEVVTQSITATATATSTATTTITSTITFTEAVTSIQTTTATTTSTSTLFFSATETVTGATVTVTAATTTTTTAINTVTTATTVIVTTTSTVLTTCQTVSPIQLIQNANFDTGYVNSQTNPPWRISSGAGTEFYNGAQYANTAPIFGHISITSATPSGSFSQDITGLDPAVSYKFSAQVRPYALYPVPTSASGDQFCTATITMDGQTLFSNTYTQATGTQSGYTPISKSSVLFSSTTATLVLSYSCPANYIGNGIAHYFFDTLSLTTSQSCTTTTTSSTTSTST